MSALSPGIRRIALEHFTGRLAHLRKQARAMGEMWHGDPANEQAQLWLAIALAAGAGPDLPDYVRAQIEIKCLWPVGKMKLPEPGEIAQPHAYLGELARARDVARAKAEGSRDQRLIQRALDLTALAEALGAPAIEYSREQGRAAA